MVDPIGAVEAWLRVVRPGGVVLFAVPDACGELANADKLRATASADHFLADHAFALAHNHTPATLLDAAQKLHGDEVSLSIATYVLDTVFELGTSNPPPPKPLPPCPGEPLAYQPFAPMMRWAREKMFSRMDVHQAHFHAWSVSTMRAMLEAARPALKTPFRIVDIFSAKRNHFQMQELHVVLSLV